ncbi:glycosyltransferase family 4 protein [bacterium]|nr:glycosyltransferase family 4 protein [bacterium]
MFTEHGRFHPDLPSRKRFIYNNILLRKKDRVIAVGESVRQALINNEGISATRIEVIYNGIDLARFENTSKKNASDDIRENLNIDSNDFVITLVGRLDYLKDHLTAVRTAECLMKSDFDFKMLFVGEGVERDKIEHEIRQRQLEGYVKLLGTRHDIPQILKASNVCFLSSISEGIPLTLIEGMAAGLPVVATNVGGIPEVVIDDETGCLADSGDEKCLASHLLRVAQDDKLCRTLGQAGQTRAQEMFSVKEMHLKYQRLYDEMATR